MFWTEWEGVWVFAWYFSFSTENAEDCLHVCAQWEKMPK